MEKAPRNQAVPSLCFSIYVTVCIEGHCCIKWFQYGWLILPEPPDERISMFAVFDLKILRVSQCKVGVGEGETCPVTEEGSHSLVGASLENPALCMTNW